MPGTEATLISSRKMGFTGWMCGYLLEFGYQHTLRAWPQESDSEKPRLCTPGEIPGLSAFLPSFVSGAFFFAVGTGWLHFSRHLMKETASPAPQPWESSALALLLPSQIPGLDQVFASDNQLWPRRLGPLSEPGHPFSKD